MVLATALIMRCLMLLGQPFQHLGFSESTVNTKTHSGLISKFSLELVKSGQVSVELGKSLNKVEDLRLMADYKGDSILEEDATWAVNQADIFVEALCAKFS